MLKKNIVFYFQYIIHISYININVNFKFSIQVFRRFHRNFYINKNITLLQNSIKIIL